MSVTTTYYRIAPGRYVRQAIMVWLGRWWWAVSLPVMALLAAGAFDARFYIVAIGTVLIIYPMIMAHIYFSYALRPEAALAVVPHCITISTEGVVIEYRQEEEGRATPRARSIPISDVSEVEDAGGALIIHLKSGKYDFIEIPAEQFKAGDMTKALSILRIDCDLA